MLTDLSTWIAAGTALLLLIVFLTCAWWSLPDYVRGIYLATLELARRKRLGSKPIFSNPWSR